MLVAHTLTAIVFSAMCYAYEGRGSSWIFILGILAIAYLPMPLYHIKTEKP